MMDSSDPGNLMRVHSKDLHDHIAQEVGDCLESGLYTDLMIRCKDGQTLHAHKLVLSAVSPYLKWLLENNDWEELQTLELPDASFEDLQLLLEVVYNGSVEATIEDLRELILLAHRLYISIPMSEELMQGLDLSLPDLPPFMPPPKISSLLSSLKAKTESESSTLPVAAAAAAKNLRFGGSPKPCLNPLIKQKPAALTPSLATTQPSPAQNITAAMGAFPGLRRKLDPSVMTAIMANSKNAEHVCPLCNLKFNKGTLFKQHMREHEDNDELREQRNAVLGEMIATCFNPQTSLYTCHVCNSNYNHSGNFKQHLLKHERESGSISATLVAQVGGNPHLTNVLQSAMADRVDKCDRESEEKRNQYRCQHCGRAFKHPGNYKQHLASHNKGGGGSSSSSSNGVKRPMAAISSPAAKVSKPGGGGGRGGLFPALPQTSSGGQVLGCPACASEFSSVEGLQAHISANHKHLDVELPAELQQTFSDRANAVLQLNNQHRQLFKCEICKQGFRSEAFLNQHKLSFHKMSTTNSRESGSSPLLNSSTNCFDCKVCGKGFSKMSKLTQHMKIHSHPEDHYKYPCDVCGKKFTRPHHVTRHKLLHTGENPFKCSRCNAGFPRVESLRTHEARGCNTEQTYRNRVQMQMQNGQDDDLDDGQQNAVGSWHVPVDDDEEDDDEEEEEAPEEMVVEGEFEGQGDPYSDESLEELNALPLSMGEDEEEEMEGDSDHGNLVISDP